MKTNRRVLWGMLAGVAALAVSSCAYDPYYEGSSYSTASYGYGHGYGGSGFSTSVFISTGDPRWGYDPYAGAYFDYTRRAYYDPYLYGYYPIGYRPRYVYGAPHPHGWRQGRAYIAPPSRIHTTTLSNYHHREHRYRDLGHDWSRNVRTDQHRSDHGSSYDGRGQDYHGRDTRQHYSPQSSPQRTDRNRGGSNWGNTTVAVPQQPNRDAGGSRLTGGRGQQVDPRQSEQRLRDFQQQIQQQEYQQQSVPRRGGRSMPQMPQMQPQAVPQMQPQEFAPQPPPQPRAAPQPQERQSSGERGGGGGWERSGQDDDNPGGGHGRGRGPRGLGEG
jgi:hypothetical protein